MYDHLGWSLFKESMQVTYKHVYTELLTQHYLKLHIWLSSDGPNSPSNPSSPSHNGTEPSQWSYFKLCLNDCVDILTSQSDYFPAFIHVIKLDNFYIIFTLMITLITMIIIYNIHRSYNKLS